MKYKLFKSSKGIVANFQPIQPILTHVILLSQNTPEFPKIMHWGRLCNLQGAIFDRTAPKKNSLMPPAPR